MIQYVNKGHFVVGSNKHLYLWVNYIYLNQILADF